MGNESDLLMSFDEVTHHSIPYPLYQPNQPFDWHCQPSSGQKIKCTTMSDPIVESDLEIDVDIGFLKKYNLQLHQQNGQRLVFPNDREEVRAGGDVWLKGCEVFIALMPRDVFEETIYPIFRSIGPIYEFRLMMDFSQSQRGYGYCRYYNEADGRKAIQWLNNFGMNNGQGFMTHIKVVESHDLRTLYVGNIDLRVTQVDIINFLSENGIGCQSITGPLRTNKSTGYAFIHFPCHREAAKARKTLIPMEPELKGIKITVDWSKKPTNNHNNRRYNQRDNHYRR